MSFKTHALNEAEQWEEGETPSNPPRPQKGSTPRDCVLCGAEDAKSCVANRPLCLSCSKTAFHGGYCQDRRPLLVVIPEGTQPNWSDKAWISRHTVDV